VYVRLSTISGDKAKLVAAVDRIEESARPRVEATAGSRGFAIFTAPDSGVVVGASYWADAAAMQASGAALAPLRADLAEAFGGTLVQDEFEVAIGFRQSIPARGAIVRLGRMIVDPERVDEAVAFHGEEVVPRIKGAAGLCSFQLLVDRASGRGDGRHGVEDERTARDFWPWRRSCGPPRSAGWESPSPPPSTTGWSIPRYSSAEAPSAGGAPHGFVAGGSAGAPPVNTLITYRH
jgi:hypothetical protein